MMARFAVYGSGGLGQVVRDILQSAHPGCRVSFFDSDSARHGTRVGGVRIVGGFEALVAVIEHFDGVVVAIGDNRQRLAMARRLSAAGVRLVSAIHPSASIAATAALEPHVVIGPRATLCVGARMASHAILSAGCVVDHDGVVGEAAHIHAAARLAGGVELGAGVTVGVGACIIQYKRIGDEAVVQPGAVVIRDVGAGEVVGGVPAEGVVAHGSRFVPSAPPVVSRESAAVSGDTMRAWNHEFIPSQEPTRR
ncbi:MAG: UDP-N-acetylbacillosamine N-acetyltransferase [Phycisphaerae bacterium]|nr:UDP-N-acetylbacillosamine N-acetyltransferase [Phycisphaerae bacterium]